MSDEIRRIVGRRTLPSSLNRESIEGTIRTLDELLARADQSECPNPIANLSFLHQAKLQAERLLNAGYATAKASVLVPLGMWGLGKGMVFPDLDIRLLGIGRHRFFLFHSALGLVALWKLYKCWLSAERDGGLANTWGGKVINKTTGVLTAGFAMGVGVHLAIDVFQPKAVIFPFIGSLVDGTLLDDNLWLLGNSLYAFKVAGDVFSLVLADEIESAKKFFSRHFAGISSENLQAALK